jgi:hypothetical protein
MSQPPDDEVSHGPAPGKVSLVETMLKLHKDLYKVKTPHVWADRSRPTANGLEGAEERRVFGIPPDDLRK